MQRGSYHRHPRQRDPRPSTLALVPRPVGPAPWAYDVTSELPIDHDAIRAAESRGARRVFDVMVAAFRGHQQEAIRALESWSGGGSWIDECITVMVPRHNMEGSEDDTQIN